MAITNPTRPLDELRNEDDIISAFKVMLEEARENATPRFRQAKKNWMFFMGQDYLRKSDDGDWEEDDNTPDWRIRVHRDIINQTVETIRPILMRGYPKYIIEADFPDQQSSLPMNGQSVPLGVTDSQMAQSWQELFDQILETRSEGYEVAKLLLNVLVDGTAYRKVLPVSKTHDLGDYFNVELPILHLEQVLPDPHGTRADFSDHKYVIVEHEMDSADIERLYHVKEADFGSASETVDEGSNGLFRRVTRYFRGRSGALEMDSRWSRRRYPVYEVYYNQATPEMVLEGDKPPKSLKYPRGRQMVIINGKSIAVDRHNPFWHGEYPIVTYQAYPLPNRFFARSDVDAMTSLQYASNVLYNMIIANALLSGNNQWLYEEDALLADYITSQPGLMIPTAPGALSRNAIQRLDPAPISRDVFQMVQELEAFGKQDIGGAGDAITGREPGPNASGVLANSLQAAAMTKQAFKMEMLDVNYRRQARLELLTMQQFVEPADPHITKRFEQGEALMWTEGIRELFFDVKVESRAELPHNVTQRLNLGLQLLQLGVYDLDEFMDFTGIRVRPGLRDAIRQASQGFVPGVPYEMQAQMRAQAAVARSQADAAQGQLNPNEQLQGQGAAIADPSPQEAVL